MNILPAQSPVSLGKEETKVIGALIKRDAPRKKVGLSINIIAGHKTEKSFRRYLKLGPER